MMYPLSGAGQRGTVYSPDGSLISFARLGPDGSLQMAVADADGTGGAQLLGPVAAGTPTGAVDTYWIFTPDGKALIVRFGNDQSGATHLVPLDGSASQLLDSGAFEFVDVQRLAP